MKCLGLALAAIGALVAVPALAQTVSRTYEFSDARMSQKDAACIDALQTNILPSFEGLKAVTLSMPVMNTPDIPTAIYAGALFASEFGDVRGTLVCEYVSGKADVHMVTVAFEGRGLAGFSKSPLRGLPPAERRAISFSSEIIR